MNPKIVQLGIKLIPRPHIKATKLLDLSGFNGQQIVHAETIKVLRIHAKTFKKLATM